MDTAIRDRRQEFGLTQRRLATAAVIVGALTLVLTARLLYLQVSEFERYSTLSQENRIDLVPVPPVRGLIYDREGLILAQNTPVYDLEITPDKSEDLEDTLDRLQQIVHLRRQDLERFRRITRRRPSFERQLLRANISLEDASRFAVSQYRFPGVELHSGLHRYYPLASLMGHVVGYVGRISEKDLEHIDQALYRGTDYIGKLGIEAYYEKTLLGTPGFQRVETNAHGREVRKLERTRAAAGRNLHLSIDARLQEVARDALGAYRGAIVAIDPANGEILAMVSKPAYDTNPFVNGIDETSYQVLRSSRDRPLLNRALHGRYAPGSTIKGLMALIARDNGYPLKHRAYCPGFYSLPNSSHRYRCWKKTGHGSLNMTQAIAQSCDVYFYRLAHALGIDRMHEYLTGFGLGRQTGVDLLDEPSGLVPSREWKQNARAESWYPGETVITGIGQGYTLVTPLQLATVTALLANRGKPVRPHFLVASEDPQTRNSTQYTGRPSPTISLGNAAYYEEIVAAMVEDVHGERGTARKIGLDAPYRIAGKTGTAQVIGLGQNETYDAEKIDERFHDHALFIAFAPADAPQIALAVIAENGGGGSKTAAPIARKIMDYYLIDRHHRAADHGRFHG